MLAVRKLLIVVAVVAFAGLGGYGAARALSTDGPDPHVDAPVVVRPANDSSPNPSGKDDGAGHPRDQRPGGDSHGADGSNDSGHGSDDHGDDRGHDDRGDDDRRDDHGGDDDDFEETHPTPDTFDDHDDDSGHGSDDDGDDD